MSALPDPGEKARRLMEEVMSRARLMTIVSHDLLSIGRLCSRVVWLHQGRIVAQGPAEEVIQAYKSAVGAQTAA